MRLTDLTIKHLPVPAKGAKIHVCDQFKGFGVRVSQAGTKAFVLTYGKHRERITIGQYPIISLAQAREKAKEFLAERTLGKNRPKRVRGEDALTRFLAEKGRHNRAVTVRDTGNLIRNHFPKVLRKNLEDVTTDDVTDVTDKLIDKDQPGAANHAFTAMRTFLRWCVKRRYLNHSPVEGVDMPAKMNQRDRVLTSDELIQILTVAADYGSFGKYLWLLALTGQRRTETASIHNDWIDRGNLQAITLPKWLTKNKQEHTFPICTMVGEILDTLPSEGLLFPAKDKPDRPMTSYSKDKKAFLAKLTERFGEMDQWQLHDFRRTFSTGLGRLGVLPHIKEMCLNHLNAKGDVERIYDRWKYLPEMRDAFTRWENHVRALLEPQSALADAA